MYCVSNQGAMPKLNELFEEPKKRTRLSLENELTRPEPASTPIMTGKSPVESLPGEYNVSENEYMAGRAFAKSLFSKLQAISDKSVAKRIDTGILE